jgi:hypothetical protein
MGILWRSWRQRRRTGWAGLRGVGGGVGSAEWFGLVGLAAAICITVIAPALQCVGVLAPLSFLNTSWVQAVGSALAVVGIAPPVYQTRIQSTSMSAG